MIRRGVDNSGWSRTPNKLVEDETLSVEARWLMAYLLSRPENWIIHMADIQRRSGGWGINKTRRTILELVGAGWIKRDAPRSGGRFAKAEYVVLSDPDLPEPEPDNGETETASLSPSNGNRDTVLAPHNKKEEQDGGNKTQKQNSLKDTPIPPQPELQLAPARPDELKEAVRLWNETAERTGLPKVQKFDGERPKHLRARLAECGGLDGWKHMLALVERSALLTGQKPGWGGATFDWVTNATNFTKIMEGNYNDRTGKQREANVIERTVEAIKKSAERG